MGGLISGITGLFGGGGGGTSSGGGGYSNILGALGGTSALSNLAQQVTGAGTGLIGSGTNLSNISGQVMPAALSQYQLGASGQLTPGLQDVANFAQQQGQLGIANTYGDLGLSGSTMEQQDLASNQLQNLAETAQLALQEEQAGLTGIGVGGNLAATGAGITGQGINALTGQEDLTANAANAQNQQVLNALGSAATGLSNKSAAGTGLPGAIGSGLGSLFGGGGTGTAGIDTGSFTVPATTGAGVPAAAGSANLAGDLGNLFTNTVGDVFAAG